MPDIFDASAHQPKKPATKSITHDQTPKIAKETQKVTPPTKPATVPLHHRDVNDYSETMRHEKASNNAFKSFIAKPTNIFFDSQHKEEHVLLLMRRHPITQLPWILIALVMTLLPSLFSSVGVLDFLPLNFQFAVRIGWYLLILGYVLESYLSWFYNVYIITDERVIDVDFVNLIYKNISAAKIDVIEDVTNTMSGIASSIFNYGTVKIQTSAARVEFEFEDVPQPAKVTAFINELLMEEEKEKNENRVS